MSRKMTFNSHAVASSVKILAIVYLVTRAQTAIVGQIRLAAA